MKRKIFFVIVFCFSFSNVSAQFVTLGDSLFRDWIDTNIPGAIVGGQLNTQHNDVVNRSTLILQYLNFINLDGIEYFINLYTLTIDNCTFSSQIIDGPIPNSIRFLNIEYTNLSTSYPNCAIPNLPNNANTIKIRFNPGIGCIPSVTNLNGIHELDIRSNNIWLCPNISNLNTLNNYYISSNQIPPLGLMNYSLPPNLGAFWCHLNIFITEIPPLPPNLYSLSIYYNNISVLPELPESLTQLWAYNNPIDCLPRLPSTMDLLDVSNTNITCLPNLVTFNYTLNPPNLNLCLPLDSCESYFNASGYTYFDNNSNGVRDSGDTDLDESVIVTIQPGNTQTQSTNGMWTSYLESGIPYTISASYQFPYFQILPAQYSVLNTNPAVIDSTLHFRVVAPAIPINDLIVDMNATGFSRPGFDGNLHINYKNMGTSIVNPTIKLILDDSTIFVSSTLLPDTVIGDTIYWNIDSLQLFGIGNFTLTYNTNINSTLGSTQTHSVLIEPMANDTIPLDNIAIVNRVVIGAYDPNDKLVSSTLLSNDEANGIIPIVYTIRFQNTGNASAIHVWLKDSLDSKLDWISFEPVSSSHPMNWELQDGKLSVYYYNIHLPDSNTNSLASQGFFKYRIKIKDTLNAGEIITNSAIIHFDFNPGVGTNTVSSYNISDTLKLIRNHKSISCFGANDGIAKVIVNGLFPPYSYLWNTNPVSTDAVLQNLNSGIYEVAVTDSLGETKIIQIEIREPNQLQLYPVITHTNPTGSNNGEINLLVNGGVSPYSYNWNGGQTTEDILNLSSGLYNITVTDKHGCIKSSFITVQ